MTGTHRLEGGKGRSAGSAPLLGLLCAALVGCGGLLDVENPNNIKGDDIKLPAAGTALANGALAVIAFGVDGAALVYQVASDEMAWKGSRDGFRELDQGKLSNAFNEFTDGFFPTLAQGRWLADEAIKVLEEQTAAGTIVKPVDLARAYLYAAIAYVSIANIYDDYALSDRRTAVPPVGPNNMGSFYDTAIGYLNKALPIATGRDATLALTIRAMRARANFDRAIWERVNPPRAGAGLVSSSGPYVSAAESDAQAVLNAVPSPTWNFQFIFNSSTGGSSQGFWINSRQENRLGGTYVALHPTDPTWLDQVVLMDPIDVTKPSPIVNATQKAFKQAVLFPSYTVVSAREMHLIIAEARLAANDLGGFENAINDLRDLDGLTNWDRGAPQVPALTLLIHSRQTNLFLQTRRLSDHYRFSVGSPEWLAGSQALSSPGAFLPIAAIECLANEHILAGKCST